MVLIEDHDGIWARSQWLARWLRVGRSAGINLVVGKPIPSTTALTTLDATSPIHVFDRIVATLGNELASMTTVTIFNRGGGRGTLRTSGRWADNMLTDFEFATSV